MFCVNMYIVLKKKVMVKLIQSKQIVVQLSVKMLCPNSRASHCKLNVNRDRVRIGYRK